MRPISRERLEAMRAALQGDGPLDPAIRNEIIAVLASLGERKSGRPMEGKWILQGLLVRELRARRGAKLKEAVAVVAGLAGVRPSAVETGYHRVRTSWLNRIKFDYPELDYLLIDPLAQKLPRKKMSKLR